MRTTNALTFLASVTMIAACGDTSSSGGGGGAGAGVVTTGPGPGSGGMGGSGLMCDLPELDLEGLWAVKITLPASETGPTGGPLSTCPGTQNSDITPVMLMRVVTLDPTHSGTFTMCSAGLPSVTATAMGTCTGGTLDLDYVGFNENIANDDSGPQNLTVASKDPGAAFSLDQLTFAFGSGPPLPEWDTANVACDDPGLGRDGCDETCVGNCENIDGYDNDQPGFTFGLCGVSSTQALEDCNLDDITSTDGTTIQGYVFSTFYLTSGFEGAFATSCQATADVTADFGMTYVGGDLYVAGTDSTVTEEVKALPEFTLTSGGGTAQFFRIDGRFGTPNLEMGDDGDTCDQVLQSLDTLFPPQG